ncbi:MAG: hypothetical protein ACOC1I_04465 [Spirochaetota bacterium]
MKRLAQRSLLILVVLVSFLALSGFGGAESERRVVAGVVAEVDERSDEWTRLVIVTADDERMDVEIPTSMARQFRVRAGDRFRSEEEVAVRPGERLRVLRFSIER